MPLEVEGSGGLGGKEEEKFGGDIAPAPATLVLLAPTLPPPPAFFLAFLTTLPSLARMPCSCQDSKINKTPYTHSVPITATPQKGETYDEMQHRLLRRARPRSLLARKGSVLGAEDGVRDGGQGYGCGKGGRGGDGDGDGILGVVDGGVARGGQGLDVF